MTIKDRIAELVTQATERAQESGALPALKIDEVEVFFDSYPFPFPALSHRRSRSRDSPKS